MISKKAELNENSIIYSGGVGEDISFDIKLQSKYNCNKLVYFEEYSKAEEAIVREKRLKKWKRDWKIKLIEDMNPSWVDISDNWNIDFNRLRDER